MKFNKEQLLLYAITDNSDCESGTFLYKIEKALSGGVTMLQLREKNISEDDYIKKAVLVKKICRKFKVPLIINDNPIVALKSGADGVHVGTDDASAEEIRKLAGSNFIIGATAKTVEQAQSAEAAGADYLGVGAVFPSPTKKNALRITKEKLAEICSSTSLPAAAIGGITLDNMSELYGGGMCGFAVVSAIFSAPDPRKAAEELKQKAKIICREMC